MGIPMGPRLSSLRVSQRSLALSGIRGDIFHGRARFGASEPGKRSLRVAVKRFEEPISDFDSERRMKTYAQLRSAGVPTVKMQLVKVLFGSGESTKILDAVRDADDWKKGEWIQVSQAYAREGKSALH